MHNPMQPDVSIFIVNWNTRDFLARCLESLPKACGALRYQVWVVDNASADGSAASVRERFPHVHLLVNDRNVGFAAGNNRAADHAEGRYFLLLNPDTEAAENSIAGLVAYADAHPEIGALGPHLLNTNGSDQRSCWRGYPGLGMALINALYLWKLSWLPLNAVAEYLPSELKSPRQVDHLLGACVLVRREAWDQVGTLDEGYFLGGEETDWCYRAHSMGWQVVYNPDFHVVHHGQQSTGQKPTMSLPRLYAGTCRFYRKHFPSRLGLWTLCAVLAIGATLRIGLWATRWLRLGNPTMRHFALMMIAGYFQVLFYLPTELFQPRPALRVAPVTEVAVPSSLGNSSE